MVNEVRMSRSLLLLVNRYGCFQIIYSTLSSNTHWRAVVSDLVAIIVGCTSLY